VRIPFRSDSEQRRHVCDEQRVLDLGSQVLIELRG
jgi:hypothetical protein